LRAIASLFGDSHLLLQAHTSKVPDLTASAIEAAVTSAISKYTIEDKTQQVAAIKTIAGIDVDLTKVGRHIGGVKREIECSFL